MKRRAFLLGVLAGPIVARMKGEPAPLDDETRAAFEVLWSEVEFDPPTWTTPWPVPELCISRERLRAIQTDPSPTHWLSEVARSEAYMAHRERERLVMRRLYEGAEW